MQLVGVDGILARGVDVATGSWHALGAMKAKPKWKMARFGDTCKADDGGGHSVGVNECGWLVALS